VQARHLAVADSETPGSQQEGDSPLPGHAAVGAVILAGKQRHCLPEQNATDPAGRRQRGRIDRHLTLQAVHHDLEELHQASASDIIKTSLAAQVSHGQALPQPPLQPIFAIAQNRQQGVHEVEQIRPVDALPSLQSGGRQDAIAGSQINSFPLRQLRCKFSECLLVIGYGSALVGRRRGTGETHADAPMVAGRYQQEGKEPAREGLGPVAETLVDPATSLLGQEDATAVAAVRQMIAPRPPGTGLLEDRQVADFGVLVPALGLDAAVLLFGERHQVFFAAGAADVTVPILHDRQMTYGQRHVNDSG
jgi:hypothetical protein